MLKQCSNPYVLCDIQRRACAAALSDPEFPKSHGADFSSSKVSAIFSKLNMKWLYVIFEIVLFGTLIETGAGFIKAVDDRIEITSAKSGEASPTWVRPVVAIGLTLLGVAVSTFGLTGLIAKGYGTICWGFLIVYVIPMLTLGIYKISKAGK